MKSNKSVSTRLYGNWKRWMHFEWDQLEINQQGGRGRTKGACVKRVTSGNLLAGAWLFASIMQNPDTISRRDAATRGWPGASSHQLRLEINRRQMRRVAGRAPSFPPSPCLADFSHPLPTIRLFSTNTKRYTRPTTPPPLYIYIYPPRIPSGFLDLSSLFAEICFSNWHVYRYRNGISTRTIGDDRKFQARINW